MSVTMSRAHNQCVSAHFAHAPCPDDSHFLDVCLLNQVTHRSLLLSRLLLTTGAMKSANSEGPGMLSFARSGPPLIQSTVISRLNTCKNVFLFHSSGFTHCSCRKVSIVIHEQDFLCTKYHLC